jgi:hypothetical protein
MASIKEKGALGSSRPDVVEAIVKFGLNAAIDYRFRVQSGDISRPQFQNELRIKAERIVTELFDKRGRSPREGRAHVAPVTNNTYIPHRRTNHALTR